MESELKPDLSLAKEVSEHFAEKSSYTRGELRDADLSEEEKMENERTIDKYDNWSRDLKGLFRAKPEKLETMQQNPDMFAEALSAMAGEVGRMDIESLEAMPKEEREKAEDTRRIFMEGCKRIYPKVKAGAPHMWEFDLGKMKRDIDNLEMPMGAADSGIDLITENLHNFRGNPEELMRMIDGAILSASESAELKAWKGVEPEFAEQEQELLSDEEEKELAKVNKIIYKLQLMRDSVSKQMEKRRERKAEKKEKKEPAERTEGEIRKSAGRKLTFLRERLGESFVMDDRYKLESAEDWERLEDGLEKITRGFLKDRRPPWERNDEYKKKIENFIKTFRK